MELKKRIGLKDIAQEVGVSMALVSYVLNNQKENRISQEVADKIRKVAKALNYQPNHIAKSLKLQKTFTLGLIVADIANSYSSQIARIIEDEAKKKGYTVIFGSSDENIEKSTTLINALLNRQVDGFIIAPVAESQEFLLELAGKGVPFVLIDRYFPNQDFSYIAIDNYTAAFNAVTHLLNNGHTHIGIINYDIQLLHLNERTRGYKEALEKNNIPINNDFIQEIGLGNIDVEVAKSLNYLLQLNPTIDAILFTTNQLTVAGLKYIKNAKIQIPQELAIVGFDETDAYDLFATSITYVKQPMEELGVQATVALIQKIENNDNQLIQMHLDTTLIIQESSI
jgi:LacI family transcriptional regulator